MTQSSNVWPAVDGSDVTLIDDDGPEDGVVSRRAAARLDLQVVNATLHDGAISLVVEQGQRRVLGGRATRLELGHWVVRVVLGHEARVPRRR